MKIRLPEAGNFSILKLFFIVIAAPCILVLITVCHMQRENHDYKVTHEVFFNIEIDGEPEGRIVFGLFGETVPLTVQNFYTLATSGFDGKKYEGTNIHRVIRKFMIQGKDTNGCQFFITTLPTNALDGKHVVFGKVVEGKGIVHKIEYLSTDWDDRPLKEVKIVKSGARAVYSSYWVSDDPYNLRDWLKTISFPLGLSFTIIFIFNHFMKGLDKCIEAEDELLKKEKELRKALKEEKREKEGEEEDEEKSKIRKRNPKITVKED